MALVVDLQVTVQGGLKLEDIERLEIRRLTALHSKRPDDELHSYVAIRRSSGGVPRAQAEFVHRYGDGAWHCVLKALEALAAQESR